MKRAFLIFIFIMATLLYGCSFHSSNTASQPLCRIVTQITVIQQDDADSTQKLYTDGDKMQSILNYLRLIDPYGSPSVDPKTVEGNTVRIIVSHSDGFEQVYEQKADRFMTVNGGRWMCIDSEKAQALHALIDDMERDPQK